MAKGIGSGTNKIQLNASRRKRPGVHAKSKTGSNPNSKNYRKRYRGQGK